MKRLLFPLFIIVFSILLFPIIVSASHISGGEITYECLGGNQYKVILKLFKDCSGIPLGNSETVDISSSCGNQTITLNLSNPGTDPSDPGEEISQLCPEQQIQSTCNGGGLPGMKELIFVGFATLQPCADWVFSWSTCCRNTTVNVPTSSGDGSLFEATLNSITDSCNSSPSFSSQPIPYVCSGQPVVFNWGTNESQGDSLTYQLIAGRDDLGNPLTYTNPYSATNPINGITINQFTGEITFTPGTLGNFILVIQVNEFDSAGNLIGTIMRDIQFVVISCSNNPPPPSQGQIDSSDFSGTANLTGPTSIEMCDGGNFTFTVNFIDPDSLDSLTLTSNVTTILPGSTFFTTPGNPASATISWTAPGNSTYFNSFTIFINDGACPVPGIQSTNYQVSVIPGTVALPDTTVLCGAQVAQLSATGGNIFAWSVISGEPIIEGVNFTCDTCPNPIATPTITTFYEVVSDLTTATCVNRDTVQVKVVPEFFYSKTQGDTAVCLQEEVQFVVTPDSTSASYSYSWTPSALLNNDSIFNPIATFITSGNNLVYFDITSLEGCSKTDSFQVMVSTGQRPNITISGDTTICFGDSTQLNIINNASQQNCNYTLKMYDSFGDGWNGASLSFFANGILVSNYTFSTGDSSIVTIPVINGNSLSISFSSGTFPSEESYILYDSQGNALFQDGPSPGNGQVWTGVANCPGAGLQNLSISWNPSTWLNDDSIPDPMVTPLSDTSYTVIVTDTIGGCADTTSVFIDVVPSFSFIKTQSDTAVCLQEEVQFNIIPDSTSASYTYSWTPSVVFDDDSSSGPIAIFTSSGNKVLYFQITSQEGCTKTDSMNVLVSTGLKPDVFIFADTTICQGDSTQLNAGILNTIPQSCGLSTTGCQGAPTSITIGTGTSVLGNTTYPAPYGNWYMGAKHQILFLASELLALGFNGGQITSLALEIASISGTTTYNNFEIKMGCTSLSSISSWQTGLVTVFPAQTINIAAGWNTHTFATGFDWDGISNVIVDICFNNQPLTWTLNSPTYYTATTFNSVVYYNADNTPTLCSSPTFANPSFNRPNVKFTTCGGAPSASYVYSWFPGGGLNDSTISNPWANPPVDTTYTVTVTDPVGGCADTASIKLYVVPGFNFTQTQSDTTICKGETVQFNVTPDNSSPPYSYSWISAGGVTLSDTGISNPSGVFDSSGTRVINFIIANTGGCEKAGSMTVLVGPAPKPIVFISGDTTICEGESTQLTATISNGGPASNYTYSWSPGISLSDDSVSNPIASPIISTPYTLIVNDTVGTCSDTAGINVQVGPLFTFNLLQSDTAICLGETVQLNVIPGAGTFTYQWSPATNLNNASISNPLAGPMNTPGNYIYTITLTSSLGCQLDSTIDFVVSSGDVPEITVTGDTIICEGDNTQLTATSTGGNSSTYLFIWTPGTSLSNDSIFNPIANPTSDISYSVTVKDTVGNCSDNATFSIEVVPIPQPQIAPLNDSVCLNDNFFQLSAIPAAGTWSGAGVDTSGTFYPSLVGPGAHNIIYSVSAPPSCTGRDTLKINVFANPAVPTAIANNPYCAYSVIDSLMAFSSGGNITWYSDSLLTDTLYSGISFGNIPAGGDSFDVWVTETSAMGCTSNGAFKLTIQVIANPQASFTANPAEGNSPLSVNFLNTSNPDTNSFSWDFAGLGSSTSDNPTFIFNEPGTYEVILISTDTNGCTDSSKVTVIVNREDSLEVPNIFTPNGDGKNDYFKVIYTALSEFNIIIFNRWGRVVYKSSDPSIGWDGKDMQGQPAHPGVYFYVITATDRNGNPINKEEIKGTVTLVRD